MTTRTGLINQILDDLNRAEQSITAVAINALADAKKSYEVERWWFNERRATFGTTPDEPRIPLPADYLELDSIVVTYNNHTYPLRSLSKPEMDMLYTQASVYTNVPEAFNIYDYQIRLYPTPDATYSMTMSYQFVMPELAQSTSNVWTNELGKLLRFHAEADIYLNHLHNAERYQSAKVQEQEEYNRMRNRSGRYFNGGKIISWL